jgi:uncharacterized damage-inducible protein DinB
MSSPVLAELLRGQGAHADPAACVEDLSPELAARHVDGFPHSIQQLIFHLNYWMDYELRRIRGQRPNYPRHSCESFPPAEASPDPQAWRRLIHRFTALLADFAALANSSPQELRRQIESIHPADAKLAGTLAAVISQMIAHNSYHLGQVALLRRMMGAWPPRGGGDSW